MSHILILHEKHGDRHFGYENEHHLRMVASHIVRERNEEGWYEDTLTPRLLADALSGDEEAALVFLRTRKHYEYEDFTTRELEHVG